MNGLQETFLTLPIITKSILLATTILSFLCALLPSPESDSDTPSTVKPLLTVVPGYALIRPWTPLTAPFTETSLLSYLVHVLAFSLMGPYFERIWGKREYFTFLGVAGVASVCCASGTLLFEYAATLDLGFIFETQVNGLGGIICGFLVAFKQTIPEHSIKIANAFTIRVKHVPSIVLLVHMILFLFRIIHASFLVNLFGIVSTWIYIRFFKRQDGIRGDRSETFSFVSFFPDILHPLLKPLSSLTYRTLVRLKLCPPLGPTRPASYLGTHHQQQLHQSGPGYTEVGSMSFREEGRTTPSGYQPSPLAGANGQQNGGVSSDAERRRAIALRELDKRLSGQTTSFVSTTTKQQPGLQRHGGSSSMEQETSSLAPPPPTGEWGEGDDVNTSEPGDSDPLIQTNPKTSLHVASLYPATKKVSSSRDGSAVSSPRPGRSRQPTGSSLTSSS